MSALQSEQLQLDEGESPQVEQLEKESSELKSDKSAHESVHEHRVVGLTAFVFLDKLLLISQVPDRQQDILRTWKIHVHKTI